jgi:hypothetical protein
MRFEWTDLTYQQILAGNAAMYVFPISVLLVFLVLAAQYESLTLPLAVILIVPMSMLSALTGVWLTQGDNNIFTQIGLMVLVGLSAKNAILIVEFARELEHDGRTPLEAAIEASRLRLRPILMTSIAFIMGVVPLVTSTGAGAEMRHAMGVAVFFGMLGVTLFGLLLTPVFYVVLRTLAGGKITWPARTRPATAGRPTAYRLRMLEDNKMDNMHNTNGLVRVAKLAAASTLLATLLAACAVGPDYKRPDVATPAAFKEAPTLAAGEQAGTWKTAEPADAEHRGEWWKVFGDPVLDALESQALAANQNLKAAAARVEEARAATRTARSQWFPQVGVGFGPTREGRRRRRSSAAGHGADQRDAVACAGHGVVRGRPVRPREPQRRGVARRPGAERGAVPFGAARAAGGRRAELLRAAPARFGPGSVPSHGRAARRGAEARAAPLQRRRHQRAGRVACEERAGERAGRCGRRRAAARGVRACARDPARQGARGLRVQGNADRAGRGEDPGGAAVGAARTPPGCGGGRARDGCRERADRPCEVGVFPEARYHGRVRV